MVTVIPQDDSWAQAGRGAGAGFVQGFANRSDEQALQRAVSTLPANASPRQILDAITKTKTYSPEAKQTALKNYIGAAELEEGIRKSKATEAINIEKNRIKQAEKNTKEETDKLEATYIESGMPEYEAKLMANPAVTPATKQSISKQHADLLSRGLRQPIIAQKPVETQQVVPGQQQIINSPEQQKDIIEEADEVNTPSTPAQEVKKPEVLKELAKPEEWPKIEPPAETTPGEREKWRTANQKENNKILKETKTKTDAHKHALLRYERLKGLNNTGKVQNGVSRILINPESGEPYGVASILGLVNKETQDYVKTLNDFLIDAKTYFGARVTNFDISSFKARLPSLLNTEDGRRVIIEQMKIMEELQLTHDTELENALKHYGRNASYSDIQNVVDQKVEKKQKDLIEKMNSLDTAANFMDQMVKDPAKYKDTKLMQNPETGKFKAFRPNEVSKALEKGWVKW